MFIFLTSGTFKEFGPQPHMARENLSSRFVGRYMFVSNQLVQLHRQARISRN